MASISEPFLLHSYAVPSTAGPSSSSSSKGLPHVQAAGRWGDVAEITVTVQGDGIHTIDRSSLHPVSSYTLGPSTFFHSPAASRIGKSGKRSTYVSIASAPDVQSGGKTAWMWPEGAEDTASRRKIELLHPIQEFLFASTLPSQVLIGSTNGSLALATTDLEQISELPSRYPSTGHARNFLFPKQAHTLGSSPGSAHQAVLVSFIGNDEGKFGVRVVRVGEDELTDVGWVPIEDIEASDVVSVSCEAGGHATLLASSGQWVSFRISTSPSLCCTLLSSPLDLVLPASTKQKPQASLLSLMSSHVLLASASPSSRQLQLELWDTRYPVQLASHTMSLPGSVPEQAAVYLSHAASGQALLTLTCPLGTKGSGDGKARSSVFVVPYSTPQNSTLLNALGRLQVSDPRHVKSENVLSESERGLLKSVGDALHIGASENAQKAFFDWVDAQSQVTVNGVHVEGDEEEGFSEGEDAGGGVNGTLDEESDEEATLTNGKGVNGTAPINGELKATRPTSPKRKAVLHLPLPLIEQLLDLLLVPSKPATEAHSSILRFLMRRGLVAYNMVRGEAKLLDVLLERGDWRGVSVALQGVVDIPESAVVQVLMVGLKGNGSAPTAPPLPNVLGAVLAAPVTRPALRLALKEQLTDMSDVCRVLEVLQGWLVQSGLSGFGLDAEGAGVVDVDFRPKPRIDSILSFLEVLLDTHFIALLQHPPARPILKELSELFTPQLSLAAQLERLRGPLEVFARRKRLQKQSGLPKAAVSRFEEGRRRKRAQEEADLQVGLYRVEEFFL